MTKKYRVHPMPIMRLFMDMGAFVYLRWNFYGQKIWVVSYAWYIEGADKNIIVDAAVSAADWNERRPVKAEDITTFEDNLSKFGLTPLDIDIVILTHLHLDHFFNARKCKNAKAIVQEEELKFAYNPHPAFAPIHQKEWYEGINFETVKGDVEIIPGIEVLFTPGHTAGTQSVSITTDKGKVVIAGFCSLDENFSQTGDIIAGDVIPGIHIDPLRCYESNMKIRKVADVIIPLHSQRFENIKSFP